jgi:hypothetical protein
MSWFAQCLFVSIRFIPASTSEARETPSPPLLIRSQKLSALGPAPGNLQAIPVIATGTIESETITESY